MSGNGGRDAERTGGGQGGLGMKTENPTNEKRPRMELEFLGARGSLGLT